VTPPWLFWRALLAFLMLPAVVAGVVPLALRPAAPPAQPAGFALIGLGAVLLLWCVRDFYVLGKGTLAPWDPPRALVITGLYRYTRNPMYVAVLTTLTGWAVAYWSMSLTIYAIGIAVAFHLRVVYGEEPWLARTHGDAWQRYASSVPRWLR
jgi:protein-S-isoprenylcysteine O-methyltransferase Ste14